MATWMREGMMQQAQPTQRTPTIVPSTTRLAAAIFFFVNGVGIGNWLVRIPDIQQQLQLTEGALGVALLGMTLGATCTMPVAGALIVRFGSRSITWVAACIYSLLIALPTIAPTLPLLFFALVAVGIFSGALDVAMNAQAIAVEHHYDRPIMASFHAVLSIGNALGGLVGGAFAGLGFTPARHLLTVALSLCLISLLASRWLLPAAVDASASAPAFARPTRAIATLGILAFCILLGEGAMAEWSAVYLRTILTIDAGSAAFGFTAFAFAMAAGRLLGDRVAQRVGPVALVRGGGSIAVIGLVLILLGSSLPLTVVGFAWVGLGFSSIFPLIISAAARTPSMASGVAIAAVSTVGYSGFLAGPPLIGFVAEVFTLRGAFVLIAVLTIIVILLARAVGQAQAK
jgi:MFS family permease